MVDTRVSEILENLSKHLEESKSNLEMLREDSSISDAIDLIQLDSDVEILEESQSKESASTDMESEIEIEDENKLRDEKLNIVQSQAQETSDQEVEQETEVNDPKPEKIPLKDAEDQTGKKKEAKTEVIKEEKKKDEKEPIKSNDLAEEDESVKNHEVASDLESNDLSGKKSTNYGSLQAYIGAELYDKRMFPHGCPSFQKAFVKLFKVEKANKGGQKLKLIDVQYFNNRDGFGFMLRNLTKGDYQVQFKKYSNGFDVYDFTLKMFADKLIKLVDDDNEELKKVKLSKE